MAYYNSYSLCLFGKNSNHFYVLLNFQFFQIMEKNIIKVYTNPLDI